MFDVSSGMRKTCLSRHFTISFTSTSYTYIAIYKHLSDELLMNGRKHTFISPPQVTSYKSLKTPGCADGCFPMLSFQPMHGAEKKAKKPTRSLHYIFLFGKYMKFIYACMVPQFSRLCGSTFDVP